MHRLQLASACLTVCCIGHLQVRVIFICCQRSSVLVSSPLFYGNNHAFATVHLQWCLDPEHLSIYYWRYHMPLPFLSLLLWRHCCYGIIAYASSGLPSIASVQTSLAFLIAHATTAPAWFWHTSFLDHYSFTISTPFPSPFVMFLYGTITFLH